MKSIARLRRIDTTGHRRTCCSSAAWLHLLGATKQQGADLLITLDASDTLLLKNVTLASFTPADARFV